MQYRVAIVGIILLLCAECSQAQGLDSLIGKGFSFPQRLIKRIGSRTSSENKKISDETASYLQTMARQEDRLRQRLERVDPAGAQRLFNGSAQKYRALAQLAKSDSGHPGQGFSGAYPAYLDSLQGSVAFLKRYSAPAQSSNAISASLQSTGLPLQAMQAKLNAADLAKAFVMQRQQQLTQYLSQHAQFSNLLQKPLAGMKQETYYYGQQVRQYKEMWTNPDRLQAKALALLNKVPAYQVFMRENSVLGGLFHLPSGYSQPQAISGLQTKAQVAEMVQGQVSMAGAGGDAALQGNLQSAETELDGYKNKLSRMGSGNGDMNMPDFKPNDQRTKSFLHRLEYGVNIQTSRTNYYFPTVTDFGVSLGYRLGHDNIIGIGGSYKLGWGNGLSHIAFSSQGVGIRSFLLVKIKGSFSATGGLEYNYTTPFTSYQQLPQLQYWTKSGLAGVTKTISMKSRVFRKTSLSLLWDFLSYQQIPQTQPFLFRIGYNF